MLTRKVIVGHVPKELSRHIWFATQNRAKLSTIVDNTKPQPLVQGGLEILNRINIVWDNKQKVSTINFKC